MLFLEVLTTSVVNVKTFLPLACACVFMGGQSVAQHSVHIHHRLLDVMGNSFSLSSFRSLTSGRIRQLYDPIKVCATTCFSVSFVLFFLKRAPPDQRRNSAWLERSTS